MGRKHKQNCYVIHQLPNKTEDKSTPRVSCRKEIARLRAAFFEIVGESRTRASCESALYPVTPPEAERAIENGPRTIPLAMEY